MPALTKVVFYDDKHWPEQAEADEIVRVTITRQPVHGGDAVTRRTELYLTGKHADELDSGLDPWFGVGHRQGSAPAGGRELAQKRNWAGGSRQASVDRHREIRKFITEHGIRSRVDASRLAFETPGGKPAYPEWAVELYDQWVADGQPAARKAS
jgi:hypothetical protein